LELKEQTPAFEGWCLGCKFCFEFIFTAQISAYQGLGKAEKETICLYLFIHVMIILN